MWNTLDKNNMGVIEIKYLHTLLSDRYGKDKKSINTNQGIIQRVIAKILSRCSEKTGIIGLQRTLLIMGE